MLHDDAHRWAVTQTVVATSNERFHAQQQKLLKISLDLHLFVEVVSPSSMGLLRTYLAGEEEMFEIQCSLLPQFSIDSFFSGDKAAAAGSVWAVPSAYES